ncbi:substrate-binding periplasmic protein [Phytopseudomonas punonensis]|uniref:Amino acid ABC transporter substrate-binding protein, PAAT family n=1 Tax=Phytopseudomonas punonensis TaxID=1220495 RepID=A0A1M6ZD95_9GAMM|nr:transporter substrate-binding domain-containing protein [Pseudomonas punonensis]SHL28461.1 amino acid ABC transporter substrate-binding protein, PAAT family [Pseudomonas punonensis]
MRHSTTASLCLALLLATSALALGQEVLRIGAEDDWYPYTAYRDGKIQGMSVDIVEAAFAASGIPIELVPYPYSRCMQMTQEGRLAACFNTAPDQRVDEAFLIPQEPLFSDDILLWARRSDAPQASSPQSLAGRKVAVTIGYEYGARLDNDPQVIRVPVRRDLSGFLMLQHERVDFVAAYRGTAQALFREKPELQGQFVPLEILDSPTLYLSFSRKLPGADTVMTRFEQGIRKLRKDGRYQAILDRWQHAPAKCHPLDYTSPAGKIRNPRPTPCTTTIGRSHHGL